MTESGTYWLLRLVFPGRWGRWQTGVLIFTVLLAVFTFFGGLFVEGRGVSLGVGLFFCVIHAYIVPIHQLILSRSVTALQQLAERGVIDAARCADLQHRIQFKPWKFTFTSVAAGLLAGAVHNVVLVSADELFFAPDSISLLPILATLLVWVVMSSMIASLVDNALLFRNLARTVPLDLLQIRSLTPFGSVAVSSTLALIGAQAAFPLMALQADVDYLTMMPGLIPTGITMVLLFSLPIGPLHRRIAALKRQEIIRLDDELARHPQPSVENPDSYRNLQPLLAYRAEISSASEWPFDTSVISRLALYLIIPPLTWVGAALIEILVDSAI